MGADRSVASSPSLTTAMIAIEGTISRTSNITRVKVVSAPRANEKIAWKRTAPSPNLEASFWMTNPRFASKYLKLPLMWFLVWPGWVSDRVQFPLHMSFSVSLHGAIGRLANFPDYFVRYFTRRMELRRFLRILGMVIIWMEDIILSSGLIPSHVNFCPKKLLFWHLNCTLYLLNLILLLLDLIMRLTIFVWFPSSKAPSKLLMTTSSIV